MSDFAREALWLLSMLALCVWLPAIGIWWMGDEEDIDE